MGDSLPPKASFDLVGSYARRRGPEVEVVLAEPELELTGEAVVRLGREGRTVEATGSLEQQHAGRRLVVRVPRSQLTDGRWTMELTADGDQRTRLDARLLVQGERPLVLLWGATNTKSATPKARPAMAARRRTAAQAGKGLDRLLTVLPPERADKVRSAARRAARRVLH